MATIYDSIIYKQKLKYFHYLGIASIVACTVVISLSKVGVEEDIGEDVSALLPAWVPVLIAILTAVVFTMYFAWVKHLTRPEVGFDAGNLNYLAFVCVSFTLSMGSIIYW